MEQEGIKFEKFTLPAFPKSNLSFHIHKDIEGLDKSQKCILDNLWNEKKLYSKVGSFKCFIFSF